MGTDWADYDNDGRWDKVVATFSNEAKTIYHNDGSGIFTDRSALLGIAGTLMPFVAFGVKWADFDNDGWQDLLFANGHVQDTIQQVDAGLTYRQPSALLHNQGGKRFVLVTPAEGGDALGRPLVGRGLAVGDYDNDGLVDALIVDGEGAPLLLHNETVGAGRSLTLRLRDARGREGGRGERHCHSGRQDAIRVLPHGRLLPFRLGQPGSFRPGRGGGAGHGHGALA